MSEQPSPSDGRKPADDRKAALGRAVSNQVAQGGMRIESQSDFNAVLVKGKSVNHVLHLILTILTVGLWAIVWIILAVVGGEKRTMVSVDDYGNINVESL